MLPLYFHEYGSMEKLHAIATLIESSSRISLYKKDALALLA
jgi:hypothetical protein